MTRRWLTSVALGAAFGAMALTGPTAGAAEFTMRIATANNPVENSFSWTHIQVLEREIEARSGGRIDVEIYPGGQLGGIESLVNQVKDGIIQGADPADGHFASTFPDIQVFGVPYLFINREIAWHVLDGPVGQNMAERMAKEVGLRPIVWAENGGFRHYTSSSKLESIDDMSGLKMRTMNHPLHMEIAKSLGMSPTPIAWGELYTALQTGVVQGQENSIPTFLIPKLYEVQKNMILDGHVYSITTVTINEAWYQGLPPDLQAVIRQASAVAKETNRGLSIANEISGRALLEQEGVTIYDPTAAEKAEMRKRAQGPAIEWLKTQFDPAVLDEVMQAVAEAEKYYGYN